MQCVESEKHFLLECSTYLEPREKLLQFFNIKVQNFAKLNIDEKFIFMLSAEDLSFLKELCAFLRNAFVFENAIFVHQINVSYKSCINLA